MLFDKLSGQKRTLLLHCILLISITSCGKKHTSVNTSNLAPQELKTLAKTLIDEKAYEEAREVLEKVITHYPDDPSIHTCKLKLADTYFSLEQFPVSHKLYSYYYQTYPADAMAEYAQYKAIQSLFKQILTPDRDQTLTEDTIAQCSNYLNNLTHKSFRDDIKAIHKACTNNLIEKEVYVLNFYMNKGNIAAAKKRLEFIKKTFLTKDASLEPQILYLQTTLALKERDTDSVQKSLHELVNKYPESPFLAQAQSLVSPKAFLF